MLPSPYRLRGHQDLERVRRSRNVVRGPRLTLRVFPRGDAGPPHIAIAVGRRVSRRAVDRNQVTRWLREGVRALLPKLRGGFDLYLSATAPRAVYSFSILADELRALCARAGLFSTKS